MPKQNPVVQSSDERHTQRGVSVMQITLKKKVVIQLPLPTLKDIFTI